IPFKKAIGDWGDVHQNSSGDGFRFGWRSGDGICLVSIWTSARETSRREHAIQRTNITGGI
ncbi:hypothetical protein, partial [Novilysobacter selenitireducens]